VIITLDSEESDTYNYLAEAGFPRSDILNLFFENDIITVESEEDINLFDFWLGEEIFKVKSEDFYDLISENDVSDITEQEIIKGV
jgi:hypothetical protein